MGVNEDDFARIDSGHSIIGHHTRKTHHADTGWLIVKLMAYESVYIHLAYLVDDVARAMGISSLEWSYLGTRTTYRVTAFSKEGDKTYKPYSTRPNPTDWPTLVFESGLSERLSRLRIDACLWLHRDVKIVIVISIQLAQKSLLIEKWCMLPATGVNPNPNHQVPTKMQSISIIQNPATSFEPASYAITGAPLILEFDKLFLRAPMPHQSNIVFDAVDLEEWVDSFWPVFI